MIVLTKLGEMVRMATKSIVAAFAWEKQLNELGKALDKQCCPHCGATKKEGAIKGEWQWDCECYVKVSEMSAEERGSRVWQEEE